MLRSFNYYNRCLKDLKNYESVVNKLLKVYFHDNIRVSDVSMPVPGAEQNRGHDLISGYKPDLDRIAGVIQDFKGRWCSEKVMIAFTLQMDNFVQRGN